MEENRDIDCEFREVMNKNKKQVSLSSIAAEVLKLLPPELRCEIDENDQRQDLSFMEKAAKQELLNDLLKQFFPVGRTNKDSKNCQGVGTLRSIGIDRLDSLIGIMTKESDETVRRRRRIYQAAVSNPTKYENLVKKIDNGSTSIEYAEKMIKHEERKNNPSPKLPDGEFDLIVMDFPWHYGLQLSGSPDYKTMTVEEGKKNFPKLPAHKNCVLCMWVTNPKIEDAMELVHFWGFIVMTAMFWVKTRNGKPEPEELQVGNGYHTKGAHEMLWICIKGKPGVPAEEDRFPTVLFAPRGKHSEKPDEMYERLEKMYSNAAKLEMFARKRRRGWTSFGDELE